MICPKCSHERNENDDPEIPDYECPSCGVIYAKYNSHLTTSKNSVKGQKIQEKFVVNSSVKNTKQSLEKTAKNTCIEEQTLAHLEMQQFRTNHVLHLILSLFTFSAWMIVWLLVIISNTSQRNKIRNLHGMQKESNILGWTIGTIGFIFMFSFISTLSS